MRQLLAVATAVLTLFVCGECKADITADFESVFASQEFGGTTTKIDDDFLGSAGVAGPSGWTTIAGVTDSNATFNDIAAPSIVRITDTSDGGPGVIANNTVLNPSLGFTLRILFSSAPAGAGETFFGVANPTGADGVPRLIVNIEASGVAIGAAKLDGMTLREDRIDLMVPGTGVGAG